MLAVIAGIGFQTHVPRQSESVPVSAPMVCACTHDVSYLANKIKSEAITFQGGRFIPGGQGLPLFPKGGKSLPLFKPLQ